MQGAGGYAVAWQDKDDPGGQSTHKNMPLDAIGLPSMEDARCVMIWTASIMLSSDVQIQL
eukprot:599643-Pelagomonas_calceolata.AAC.1